MTTDDRFEEIEARLAELEKVLLRAVFIDNLTARRLEVLHGLAASEAKMLMALYAAGGGTLRACEIDQMVVSDRTPVNRADPEYRSLITLRQWAQSLRKKLGPGIIGSRSGVGYWITDMGKMLVERAA